MARTRNLSMPSFCRMPAYFWPYMRQHRRLIAVSMMALFAEVILRLLEPWPLKFVFDRLMHSTQRHAVLSAISSIDSRLLLSYAAIALVIITGLRALASYWSTIGFAHIGNRVIKDVRDQLYRHIQYLSLSFHTKSKTGDLVMRVITDVSLLQDVAVTAVLPMLGKTLVVIGMLGLMLWLNWRLTVVALSVLPLLAIRTHTLTQRIGEVARKQRQREGAMATTAAESIGAIRTVQALSLENIFAKSFSTQSEKNVRQDVQSKRLAARLGRSVDFLLAISTALVLWYGGRLALRDEITPGDLIVFLAYLKYAYRPVQDFSKYTGRMAKASAAGERVLDLLSKVPDVRDLPNAIRAPAFCGAVQFENVSFTYEPGHPVLSGIELEVRPGQRIAIVGPSGSGKSTLVGLILRLYDPSGGIVKIDGQNIRGFTLESLRGQISVVLQDNFLFAATVRDNIAWGAPSAAPAEVEEAARLANAHDFITALPNGYETILGERGVTVSQGQRQRIAIARAAIRNAPILILDEPTTGLDKKNQHAVLDALDQLNGKWTIFLITHDLECASRADRIVFLEQGQIIEQGNHEALLSANGRYAALYRLGLDPEHPPFSRQLHALGG